MHEIIAWIGKAESAADALAEAHGVFERLCGEDGQPFDYFVTFDREGVKVAGRDRWGPLPVAATVASPEGRGLLRGLMRDQRKRYLGDLARVRSGLAWLTDEEIWLQRAAPRRVAPRAVEALADGDQGLHREPSTIRHFLYVVGQYRGPTWQLYAEDGEAITAPSHCKRVIERAGGPRSGTCWIVPADVHF